MKTVSEVKTTWIDPLTFKEMKLDDRVTLKSDNGIISDFIIGDIYDNDSILLKKPKAVVFSSLKEKALVVHPSIKLDAKTLRPNDIIQLKLKNGKVFQMRVELIFNKDFLILGPAASNRKLSYLNKLKLLWK